jgi:catechol 2,3-dioxygenase
MSTDPLDVEGVLSELNNDPDNWTGLSPDTVLGHMHLHVANIPEAEEFYTNIIGFEVMVRFHASASFLSAGGYHHHLGINTWNGVGAPPPPSKAVGLRYFVIRLPDDEEKEKLIIRLEQANISFERHADDLLVRDPSQNGVRFTVK